MNNSFALLLATLKVELNYLAGEVQSVEKFNRKFKFVVFPLGLILFLSLIATSIPFTNLLLMCLFVFVIVNAMTVRWLIAYRFNVMRYQNSIDQKINMLISIGIPFEAINLFVQSIELRSIGKVTSEYVNNCENDIVAIYEESNQPL